MSDWVGVIGGAGGLVMSVIALASFLQNRRVVAETNRKLIAETRKVAVETTSEDVLVLRGIIAEIRALRADDAVRIAQLEVAVKRYDLLEKARLAYETGLSEFIAEHWRLEHPGERPRPPTFQHVEL